MVTTTIERVSVFKAVDGYGVEIIASATTQNKITGGTVNDDGDFVVQGSLSCDVPPEMQKQVDAPVATAVAKMADKAGA